MLLPLIGFFTKNDFLVHLKKPAADMLLPLLRFHENIFLLCIWENKNNCGEDVVAFFIIFHRNINVHKEHDFLVHSIETSSAGGRNGVSSFMIFHRHMNFILNVIFLYIKKQKGAPAAEMLLRLLWVVHKNMIVHNRHDFRVHLKRKENAGGGTFVASVMIFMRNMISCTFERKKNAMYSMCLYIFVLFICLCMYIYYFYIVWF